MDTAMGTGKYNTDIIMYYLHSAKESGSAACMAIYGRRVYGLVFAEPG
jgi:hypothetical protein